ncbi:MAG: hypothetical protein F6K26_39670 [Moorea sp. SIO2I5]|nr:hypothetical protein [Moorena sp. SIO2I5]
MRRELKPLIKYAPVQDYLDGFEVLHNRHIKALEKGQLVLAAEILRKIHTLSITLDSDESLLRERDRRFKQLLRNEYIAYMRIFYDSLAVGDIIELYAGIELSNVLAIERKLRSYSSNYCIKSSSWYYYRTYDYEELCKLYKELDIPLAFYTILLPDRKPKVLKLLEKLLDK